MGKRKAKGKRNSGWFQKGFDPRRHQLTLDERRRGGIVAWFKFGYWQGEPRPGLARAENTLDKRNSIPF